MIGGAGRSWRRAGAGGEGLDCSLTCRAVDRGPCRVERRLGRSTGGPHEALGRGGGVTLGVRGVRVHRSLEDTPHWNVLAWVGGTRTALSSPPPGGAITPSQGAQVSPTGGRFAGPHPGSSEQSRVLGARPWWLSVCRDPGSQHSLGECPWAGTGQQLRAGADHLLTCPQPVPPTWTSQAHRPHERQRSWPRPPRTPVRV